MVVTLFEVNRDSHGLNLGKQISVNTVKLVVIQFTPLESGGRGDT